MTLNSGDLLVNRYRIVKLVGQGGFGAVYRAWDTSLGVPVAVKENLDTSAEAQRQFEQEARLLAPLRHPNLPRVGDHFFIPNQGQYLVMDFVEGKSLHALLEERGGPLGEAEALGWIGQVCDALEYLHMRTPPIIHRDIKPQNIIITTSGGANADGRAVLVDFGISKAYDPTLTTTRGARAVTPGFSPPEQYGMGKTDARSDVYALGATLYTLLTGAPPPESVALIAGGEVVPPIRRVNPAVNPATEAAVAAAMALASSQRLGGAGELREALAGRAVAPLSQVGRTVALPAAGGRRGAPAWLLVVVGLAAVAIIAVGAFLLLRPRNEGETGEQKAGDVVEATATTAATNTAEATATESTTAVAEVVAATKTAVPTVAPATPPPRRVVALPSGVERAQVLVSAGSFMRGADDDNSQPDEAPIRLIGLDAFYIDETEVTNTQFASFLNAEGIESGLYESWIDNQDDEKLLGLLGDGFEPLPGFENHPVIEVTWNGADAYCAWAGGRLPTEAEWEYAARGPEGHVYPGGDVFECGRLNADDETVIDEFVGEGGAGCDGFNRTAPVGSFPSGASWVGALDMAGNVWEWVNDWYQRDYYALAPDMNPPGPVSNPDNLKVVRGGSWFKGYISDRASFREHNEPTETLNDVGFRCAYDLEPPPLSGTQLTLVSNTDPPPGADIRFVSVPAGPFVRGSTPDDPRADNDESPQRTIDLDAFRIARTETTNREFAGCVAAGACRAPQSDGSRTRTRYYGAAEFAEFPVVNVTWEDAADFCAWAGGRLPTEAEWEKAARGADGADYPWGDAAPSCALANYNSCVGDTTMAGAYPSGASPSGALDMAGNVWEWVADWYDGDYYAVAPAANPPGPSGGEGRVFRGGAWDDAAILMRAAYRDAFLDRSFNLALVGFRCAWDAE